MFSAYEGFIGDQFLFSLVLILRIPAYLGVKGDQFFFRPDFFLVLVLRTNWCTTICITCPILRKNVQFLREIECNKFVYNKFVSNLVQIDLIQFEFSNCIRSICTETNANLLHSNLHKIGHIIQIVVHQFVHKMSTEKKSCLKKNGPTLSPGTREYIESVLRRKKLIPYKPYVRGKHVESILGICKNMTKKVFNLNNTIPHSVHLVDPYHWCKLQCTVVLDLPLLKVDTRSKYMARCTTYHCGIPT